MRPDEEKKIPEAGEAQSEAALPDEKLEGVAGGLLADLYDANETD